VALASVDELLEEVEALTLVNLLKHDAIGGAAVRLSANGRFPILGLAARNGGNGARRVVHVAAAERPLSVRSTDLRRGAKQCARCADSRRSRDDDRTPQIDP
jgi:hypothetical protein